MKRCSGLGGTVRTRNRHVVELEKRRRRQSSANPLCAFLRGWRMGCRNSDLHYPAGRGCFLDHASTMSVFDVAYNPPNASGLRLTRWPTSPWAGGTNGVSGVLAMKSPARCRAVLNCHMRYHRVSVISGPEAAFLLQNNSAADARPVVVSCDDIWYDVRALSAKELEQFTDDLARLRLLTAFTTTN